MFAPLAGFVKRHAMLTFVVLSYLFSWWVWPLYIMGQSPSPIIGFGPFLAAVVVLALTSGRAAVGDLLRRMAPMRIGWRWYALALALPIVLNALATWLTVLLGAPTPTGEQLASWTGLWPTFLLLLLVPGIGGAWEEPGWRGYALPRLEVGRSRLAASAIMWFIIVGWHLPLFVTGGIVWADVAGIAGAVIVMNWLFHSAHQNILVVMLLHAMNNTVAGEYFGSMFTGADAELLGWMRAVVWGVLALGLILMARHAWLDSERPSSTETLSNPIQN